MQKALRVREGRNRRQEKKKQKHFFEIPECFDSSCEICRADSFLLGVHDLKPYCENCVEEKTLVFCKPKRWADKYSVDFKLNVVRYFYEEGGFKYMPTARHFRVGFGSIKLWVVQTNLYDLFKRKLLVADNSYWFRKFMGKAD